LRHRWIIGLVLALLAFSTFVVAKTTLNGKPWRLKQGLDLAGGVRVVLQAETKKLPGGESWKYEHLNSIIRIIRDRVDTLGVSEPLIQPKGSDQVVVELPDIKDKDEAIKQLKSTARMEFRHLHRVHNADAVSYRPAAAKCAMSIGMEDGKDVFTFTDAEGNTVDNAKIIAESRLILTGNELKAESRTTTDDKGRPAVSIEFTPEGRKKFAEFTKRNVGEILAIILDDEILSAPYIKQAITHGGAIISGGFTSPREAQRLAEFINAGALPVPLKVVQIQSVEATLGRASVTQSVEAGAWGIIAVIVFMVGYYLLPGLVADVALGIYALLTLAGFKLFGVTMTLPGIAAYILSIGMAVDANILIFERLKEELRGGKTLKAAIDAGFSRAFTSIFDSNMCTLITCVILRWLGTGPIRGFALVLGMGVAISMFTAITVTRTILYLIVNTRFGESPALFGLGRQWVTGRSDRQVDIVGLMKVWFALSAIVLIPGLYYWLGAHGLKGGIDFTGGSLMQVEFKQPVQTTTIDEALADVGLSGSLIQRSTDKTNTVFIRTKNIGDISEEKSAHVQASLKSLGGTIQASENVGPAVSRELTTNAIKAVLFAALAIVLYLSVRFAIGGLAEGFKFGVCAILATLHDVGVIIGVFAILGHFFNWEIDSLFVTAVLTIIGFSTHDTIVIFDRIRENLRHRVKGESFDRLANKSILQSFARSINTSLTVVLTLVFLLIFGAENIRHFVVALLIGVISGTYSSIFNASQLLVLWYGLTEKQPAGVPVEPAVSRAARMRELKPIAGEDTGPDGGGYGVEGQLERSAAAKAVGGKAKAKKRKRRF